jgi:hypothetical protein
VGVQEPSGPLWSAVKAIHDPWPLDDEIAARDVGGAWKTGGTAVAKGAADATRASGNVLASWQDSAGQTFNDGVQTYAQSVSQVTQRMQGLAARGENYAQVLVSAKNTIVSTIAANDQTYQILNMLGPLGAAAKTAFVAAIATYLSGMIDQQAAALRANPTNSAAQPEDSYGLDDLLADGLRAWGDFDQWTTRQLGEAGDDFIDDIGNTIGGVVSGIGQLIGNEDVVKAGDQIKADADAMGDDFAEHFLEVGAEDHTQINHGATAIDGDKVPLTVYVSHERYPEAAQHIDEAQGGVSYRGTDDTAYAKQQPSELTVNRGGAGDNRAKSLSGIDKVPGKQLDEYPPALFEEGGTGASVKAIDPHDNTGSGSSIGHQVNGHNVNVPREGPPRRVDDGEQVIIKTF